MFKIPLIILPTTVPKKGTRERMIETPAPIINKIAAVFTLETAAASCGSKTL